MQPVAVFNDDVQFDPEADVDETLKSSVGIVPYTVDEFKEEWEKQKEAQTGAKPGANAWNSYITQVKAGRIWNLTVLRRREAGAGIVLTTPTLIIDFHEVFNLPVRFLRPWLEKTGKRRLRLCPPYREHLSQAFARYFMRVGLHW